MIEGQRGDVPLVALLSPIGSLRPSASVAPPVSLRRDALSDGRTQTLSIALFSDRPTRYCPQAMGGMYEWYCRAGSPILT